MDLNLNYDHKWYIENIDRLLFAESISQILVIMCTIQRKLMKLHSQNFYCIYNKYVWFYYIFVIFNINY